jgi:6-pyruvoyltetrahydropterin/6-carboxytetrahydropterin synthase
MITVTKEFQICYGHSLPGYDGLCKNQHGHNSTIQVEFGPSHDFDEEIYPTMVIDFADIKKYVGPFIEELDHRNLNDIFEYPTAETIVDYLVTNIQKYVPFGHRLLRLRLYETPTSYAEWRK